jgi:hypothetical protein
MIATLVAMTSSFSWLKRPTPGVKTGGFFCTKGPQPLFSFWLFYLHVRRGDVYDGS